MADRTESLILDFEIDEQEGIESIENLTKANKALREERKKLDTQSVEGKKRISEINAELDKNNTKIKENVSALEKQKINIGNYTSALDKVNPVFGKLAMAFDAGVDGLKKVGLEMWKLVKNPVGAVIAALVAVFLLLKTALSQNDALMDKFENVTNAVSVVMEVLVNRVAKLGEALIALFSGDINGAINATSAAFTGLSEEIGNAVRQQQLFLDASRDLEDSQRKLRIEAARQENVIRQLVVASKNRNLTFDEQEEKLKEALRLEKELVRQREDLARRDLVITARQLKVSKEFQQQSNETFDEYIERLLNSSALGGKELDKIVDKVEALEQARGSSLAFQEKVENSLSAIQEKRALALEKQNEALKEQQALERANRRADDGGQTLDPGEDPLIAAFETRANVITSIEDRLQKDLKKRRDEAALAEIQREKAAILFLQEKEREKLSIIQNTIGQAASLFEEDTVAYKALASAQALINTYLAATAAFASGSKINVAFGVISAAVAVAAGLANVAKINGVQFADGGYTGPGGKYKPAGIVHAGEVVWSQEDVAKAGGPMRANMLRPTMRGYYDGGYVANSITQPINNQMDILKIVKAMPRPIVGIKQFAKEWNAVEVKQNASKI